MSYRKHNTTSLALSVLFISSMLPVSAFAECGPKEWRNLIRKTLVEQNFTGRAGATKETGTLIVTNTPANMNGPHGELLVKVTYTYTLRDPLPWSADGGMGYVGVDATNCEVRSFSHEPATAYLPSDDQ